jgi:hypothetical protein
MLMTIGGDLSRRLGGRFLKLNLFLDESVRSALLIHKKSFFAPELTFERLLQCSIEQSFNF